MPFLTDMYDDQNGRNPRRTARPSDAPAQEAGAGADRRPSSPGFDTGALAERLRARIVGQKPAIDAVVRALVLAEAGAHDPARPLANLLLVGPTGVGKTELVRRVAAEVRSGPDDLCRVDMNALAQEHYAASFSGAPPGYAGSKEAFSVFDRTTVEGDPYTPGIVLFDEVEKAHPTVLRALLHVLDTGVLRLANGQQTISFRNSFVFLTSNLGSAELARRRRSRRRRTLDALNALAALVARLGGHGSPFTARLAAREQHAVISAALRGHFDPEFLNRLDETLVFGELDTRSAERIVELEIDLLRRRLRHRGVQLEVDASVLPLLRERGFDPVYGARGLRRALRTELAGPVAEEIVRARAAADGAGGPLGIEVTAPAGVVLASASPVRPYVRTGNGV